MERMEPALRRFASECHADGHFVWGSVMYGYLIYDTSFTLVFYRAVGSPSFLVHHVLGLACCCFGLYFNKCERTPVDRHIFAGMFTVDCLCDDLLCYLSPPGPRVHQCLTLAHCTRLSSA